MSEAGLIHRPPAPPAVAGAAAAAAPGVAANLLPVLLRMLPLPLPPRSATELTPAPGTPAPALALPPEADRRAIDGTRGGGSPPVAPAPTPTPTGGRYWGWPPPEGPAIVASVFSFLLLARPLTPTLPPTDKSVGTEGLDDPTRAGAGAAAAADGGTEGGVVPAPGVEDGTAAPSDDDAASSSAVGGEDTAAAAAAAAVDSGPPLGILPVLLMGVPAPLPSIVVALLSFDRYEHGMGVNACRGFCIQFVWAGCTFSLTLPISPRALSPLASIPASFSLLLHCTGSTRPMGAAVRRPSFGLLTSSRRLPFAPLRLLHPLSRLCVTMPGMSTCNGQSTASPDGDHAML
mmetsp:Transcript_7584/g.15260  ORF Transcript_7584/g.15260 Transcript_7584/m.15260 type:complete len:346 (-) Transcript_7584:695-1732(-)